MGNSSTVIKQQAIPIVLKSIESYIEGKIGEITVDTFDKLTNIITSYIKGQSNNFYHNDDDNDDEKDNLLNRFIQSLETLNTSTIASPCHSEFIQDIDIIKDIRFMQLKQQYFEIESKIRSNYRNLLDQNLDNFFQYFELENITRQLYDLLNMKTFFGDNPIDHILFYTDYHFRKVNDFYVRYMQLVLKGMILVLTYHKLNKNKKNIKNEIQRLCVMFNELNKSFQNALSVCINRMYDHQIIEQEVVKLITKNFKINKWMHRNPVNRILCNKIYDYFNDKYDWNKWCCYATKIDKRYNAEIKPFSFFPHHRIYKVDFNGIYVILLRVNQYEISRAKLDKYKLMTKDFLLKLSNGNLLNNPSQLIINGICKGLMDKLSLIDRDFDVSLFVTTDKSGYFFQNTNDSVFVRNIHRKFMQNRLWNVILCDQKKIKMNGYDEYERDELRDYKKMIKLQNKESGSFLGVNGINMKITENNIDGDHNCWNVYQYSLKNGNVVLLESVKYRGRFLIFDCDGNVKIGSKLNEDGAINTDCILIFNRDYKSNEYRKWYGFVPKQHAFAIKDSGILIYVALQKGARLKGMLLHGNHPKTSKL